MEMLPDVFTTGDIILSFVLLASGVVLNWLHKCYTLDVSWTAYWTTHGGRSIMTISACIMTYFGLVGAEVLDPITYFMSGFMCDSLINKPPVVSTVTRNRK